MDLDRLTVANRRVPRVYPVVGRNDVFQFIVDAVEGSGGTVIWASHPQRVPVYVAYKRGDNPTRGLMIYPFRMTRREIMNRPTDEVRGQLRYGSEWTWESDDHFIARDIAGVDTTILVGAFLEQRVFVGLDPALYDPMPLGISVYAKASDIEVARRAGWHVWERTNRAGKRRSAPRATEGLETLVAFRADRLLDYSEFEASSSLIGLDQPLRFAAAREIANQSKVERTLAPRAHSLEESFDLDAHAILDIIHTRMRLEVAVKGGVAEYHLERALENDALVSSVDRLDEDGQPDFRVVMADGSVKLIECKNVSPQIYSNGDFKVEVQKTRATKDDPAGRLYRPSQFDVVAACLYSPTRQWAFRYIRVGELARHPTFRDRLAATHRVDGRWYPSLAAALAGGES